MSADPGISVIVAVYEHPDALEMVFESFTFQTFADFEVLLADDGSGPSVERVVRRYADRLPRPVQRVWHEDEGFRKTVIVNRAVTRAASEYLVFIDGDCILHHRFLERHFRRRERGCVLTGRRVKFDRELTDRTTLEDVRSRRIESPLHWWGHVSKNDRWRGFYLPVLFGPRNLFRRRHEILGSNFSLYKDDFLRVNGYDERIVGRGLEDNNLCARFINSGFALKSVTYEALQYHLHHAVDDIPHDPAFIERFRGSRETRTPFGIVKDPRSSSRP